ncbi:hypothetical protein NLO88_23895 [Pseudomonas syringae]|nr:hypothetical protein [Pseudomonas syringae]
MSGGKMWVTAGLAVMINGSTLLGIGQNSVGGVARNIECRYEIALAIELSRAQKVLAGNRPEKVGVVV